MKGLVLGFGPGDLWGAGFGVSKTESKPLKEGEIGEVAKLDTCDISYDALIRAEADMEEYDRHGKDADAD